MSAAIETRRDRNLAGWPFWTSILAHLLGVGAVSAVAVTFAPLPPVPIELVSLEKAVPAEVPNSRQVKAPVTRPILQQPMTAPVPASSEPPSLLDDTPKTETAPRSSHRLQPRRPPARERSSRPAIFRSSRAAGRIEDTAETGPARRSSRPGARRVSPTSRGRSAGIRRHRDIPSRRGGRVSRASPRCASSCSRTGTSGRSPSLARPDTSISIAPRWTR